MSRFSLAISCLTTSNLPWFMAMAPHSSTLAWKIPWMEESGGPQSMGSLKVGHDWTTSFSLFTFMHWRRKWQPTPVFLPGKSHGWRNLVGYNPWGHKESDMIEWLTLSLWKLYFPPDISVVPVLSLPWDLGQEEDFKKCFCKTEKLLPWRTWFFKSICFNW